MSDLKCFLLCIFGFILLVTGVCVYFLSFDEKYLAGYNGCAYNYNDCVSTYKRFYRDYELLNCDSLQKSNYPSPDIYPIMDSFIYIGDVNAGIAIFSIGSVLIFFTFPITTYRFIKGSRTNFTETTVQTEQQRTRQGIFGVFGERTINIFRRTPNNREHVVAELTDIVEEQPNANTRELQTPAEINESRLEQEDETKSNENEEDERRKQAEFTQLIDDAKEKLDSVQRVFLDNLLEAQKELVHKSDNTFAAKQLEKAQSMLISKLNSQEIIILLDKQRELIELGFSVVHDDQH